jgi:hypothetical protein
VEKLTKQALKALRLSASDLASLVKVSPRAVNMWLSSSRSVPGPVLAYLSLFANLPKATQAQELAKARRQEGDATCDGIYALHIKSEKEDGAGILVLMAGRVFGSDQAGVSYDGEYQSGPLKGQLTLKLRITVPAGVELLPGTPAQPAEYWFPLEETVQVDGRTEASAAIKVKTPYSKGTVEVWVKRLRGLPGELT